MISKRDRRTFSKWANFIFIQIVSFFSRTFSRSLAHRDSYIQRLSTLQPPISTDYLKKKKRCVDFTRPTINRFKSMPSNVCPITRNDQNCCLINLTHRLQLFVCHIFMNYLEEEEIKFMRMWNRLYNFLWTSQSGRPKNEQHTTPHHTELCVNMEQQC